jgi:hypothetical protein
MDILLTNKIECFLVELGPIFTERSIIASYSGIYGSDSFYKTKILF